MSNILKFVIAASFIVCLLMGCKAAPQIEVAPQQTNPASAQTNVTSPQTTVQVIMEGGSEAQAALFKLAQQDPTVTDPQTGLKYFIMPIKPGAGIDYKIVQIKPDPTIDYKMIIAGPKSQTELLKLRKQIADAIQKQLQQQKNKDK